MKKILVLSHDASLSGATILLLNLIHLLKENDYRVNIVIKNKRGVLADKFEAFSEEFGFYNKSPRESLLTKMTNKVTGKNNKFNIKPYLKGIDFVISNTIANGEILAEVRKNFEGQILSYVHELEFVWNIYRASSQIAIENSNKFLVPCESVKRYLIDKCKIPVASISQLNYYIPCLNGNQYSKTDEDFKKTHSITASFIVGAIGTMEWRKGTDLFIQTAIAFFKKYPDANMQFVWMGGNRNSAEFKLVELDLIKMKFTDKIKLLEACEETAPFYKCIDILLLTSREDSYPLVVPEAASEKKPSVCFNLSGGAAEFIEEDAGELVEYLDIEMMADAVYKYYTTPHLCTRKGERAYEKWKQLHENKKLIMSQFNKITKTIK